MAPAAGARVMAAVEEGVRAVLPGVIEDDRLLQVGMGRGPVAREQIRRSQRVMSLQEECRVLGALGQAEKLLPEVQPGLDVRKLNGEEPQSPQRREKLRRFSHLPA